MTQDQQEILNETFLGKEDPDMAFKKTMTNNLKEEIEKILTQDDSVELTQYPVPQHMAEDGWVGATTVKVSEKAIQAILTLINQKEKEAEVRALESLLDNEIGAEICICQLADTEVCDHNWSLCNVVRDRIKQLKEELKGGEQ